MKIINTQPITDSASFPLKSGTIDFLQESFRDLTTALLVDLLGFEPNYFIGYKIFGVDISNVGSTYTVTSGYIYYQNEMFRVESSTFNLGSGEQVWGKIINVPFPAADPVLFGDGVERSVHLNRKIEFGNAISGDLLYSNTVAHRVHQAGDIKWVYVDNNYINANFDINGIGRNERQGWKICNGFNGTPDMHGRVAIGWGAGGYNTVGFQGGSADAVVVSHTHVAVPNTNIAYGSGDGVYRQQAEPADAGYGTPIGVTVGTTGENGAGKNMQPFTVFLCIMKM